MTYENFTIKAQDAILRAQEIATNLDQQIVDSCHLAKAVIEVDEKLAEFIFSKLAVNVQKLKHELDTAIRSVPKVQGGGKQYLSNDANQILVQAKKLMPEFGDEYISLELILMAIAKGTDSASKIFKSNGISAEGIKQGINFLACTKI